MRKLIRPDVDGGYTVTPYTPRAVTSCQPVKEPAVKRCVPMSLEERADLLRNADPASMRCMGSSANRHGISRGRGGGC